MNKKIAFIVVVGAVLAGGVAAYGQDWGTFPYAPAYWGYGYAYVNQSVPYYALHPPVYYSYRVARTYGYSPFAYPPGVLTPSYESARAAAASYPPGDEADQSQQRQPQPLRIDNPFVEHSNAPGVTSSRKAGGRRPQVVYPASLAQRGS